MQWQLSSSNSQFQRWNEQAHEKRVQATQATSKGSGEPAPFAQSRHSLGYSLTQYKEIEKASDNDPHFWPFCVSTSAYKGSQIAQHKGPFSHEMAQIITVAISTFTYTILI